jgi:hypothetical protein
MRRVHILFITFVTVALGCGPEFAVVPRNGMEQAVGQVNGVTITAFANQWDGYPYDLADYVTPIAVELYNGSPNEVRVTYADLALRDSSGFRYSAVNPYIPATTVGDAAPILAPPSPQTAAASAGGVVLASFHGGGGGGGVHVGAPGGFGGAGVHVAPPAAGRGYGGGAMRVQPGGHGIVVGPPGGHRWGYGGGGWHGYLVAGGLRPYYGWGVGYWGGPWIYPPWYYDWVATWGPAYYPAQPSADVLTLGLPEGVLPPGAHVSGFLYFKRATGSRQGALDLSWDVHEARTGAALAQIHVPLEVVHR